MSFMISKEQLMNGVKNEMFDCVDCDYCRNHTDDDGDECCLECGSRYLNFEYDSNAIMLIVNNAYNGAPLAGYHVRQAVIDCVRKILWDVPYFKEDTDNWYKTPVGIVNDVSERIVDFMDVFLKLMQRYKTNYECRVKNELAYYHTDFYRIDRSTVAFVFDNNTSHTIAEYGVFGTRDFIEYMENLYDKRINEPFNILSAEHIGSFDCNSFTFERPKEFCTDSQECVPAPYRCTQYVEELYRNSWFREMVNENKEMFSKTVQRYWE